MKVLITEKLSENRFIDGNGYLVIKDNVVARTGKQTYKHAQVYEGSTDMTTDVDVDRPESEVFSPETIASFENTPITREHPNEKVTPYNIEDVGKGFARDIRRGTAINPETGKEEPVLLATTIITHQEAIDAVMNGELTHWSCGYDTEITQDENPKQTRIRGNHIALCTNPRAGKIAKISDEADKPFVPHFIQTLTDAVTTKEKLLNEAKSKFKVGDIVKHSVSGKKYKIKTISGEDAILINLATNQEEKDWVKLTWLLQEGWHKINDSEDLEGGKADKMTPQEIAKKHGVIIDKIISELLKGIKVEMEHTNDRDKAYEITMDHLFEMPDYYTKLDEMENH